MKHKNMSLKIKKSKEELLKDKIANEVAGCYYLKLNSKHLPFCVKESDFTKIEESELRLQDFMALIEKKFDAIWYIGADYLGNELFERFIFHNGGLMEVSLNGKIRCFFRENKRDKMEKALFCAVSKMGSENMAKMMKRDIKMGKRLISLRNSLFKEVK